MTDCEATDGGRMEFRSVYVGVEDMDRALEFYRDVFGKEPSQVEEQFSTFEFERADFGLYGVGYVGFDLEFGNNCIPNFEVHDVDEAYRRIGAIAPEVVHDEIFEFGSYRTFHFVDTEGNEIEVFNIESP